MKRVLTVAIALLLCLSIALPLGANAAIFHSPDVPKVNVNITNTTLDGLQDVELLAVLEELANQNITLNDCVQITTVEDAKSGNPDITAEEKATLIAAYDALVDGSEALPIDGEYAVREIVDISFKYEGCRLIPEHGKKDEALKAEGVTLTVKLNLGVEAGANIAAFTRIDGEWAPVVETVNNGDGTVTCVFEDLCPVAFAVLG